jgi:hypothetical protein
MFARITRYEGGSPEAIDGELARKKHVLPTAPGQTEGMSGAIFCADRSTGTILAISLWEDEEALRASEEMAAKLRDEVTAEAETASVEHFEVAFFEIAQA